MKILKYEKINTNEYKITTDKEAYKLYDDTIIKYELLLKKEIDEKEFVHILEENNNLKAYYASLKAINTKMRCESEIESILKKKGYQKKEIEYTIKRLNEDGYLKRDVYIEAYIHDALALTLTGENKIRNDLMKLGFKLEEINPSLEKVDKEIYLEKIKKYVDKKVKVNKKSVTELKRKVSVDLVGKGFKKEDVLNYIGSLDLSENEIEIEKLVNKLYQKYRKKYDEYQTLNKIRSYLYSKGYQEIESYIEKVSN